MPYLPIWVGSAWQARRTSQCNSCFTKGNSSCRSEKARYLPKIKEDEIQDRSKADSVAKAVAVAQTLWFGIQAAHRVSKGLDVTKLEITTFGHVVLNIFIYFFWWNKPLNVRFPINVYPKKSEDKQEPSSEASSNQNNSGQETESQTPLRPSLPFRVKIATLLDEPDRFWGSFVVLLVVLLGFAMSALFGGIHCLAWNSPFPTDVERILWRVCAPIVTAAPALGVLTAVGGAITDDLTGTLATTLDSTFMWLEVIFVLAYSLARICLLVLSLTSLRALPYNAYQNPPWTLFFPHIS